MVSVFRCPAQDTLYFRSGELVTARVSEINQTEVVYKRYENLNGPVYRISKSDLEKIVFENGLEEFFSDAHAGFGENPFIVNPKRNLIGMDLADLLFRRITFSYEHLFGENKQLGVWGAYTIADYLFGLTGRYSGYGWNVKLAGLFYPFGHRKLTYFVGPTFVYGELVEPIMESGVIYNLLGPTHTYFAYNSTLIGGYITQGMRIHLTETVGTSFTIGVGSIYDPDDNEFGPTLNFRGNIEIKF